MSEPSLDEEDYLLYEQDEEEIEEEQEDWPEIGQFYTPKQRTWEGTYE